MTPAPLRLFLADDDEDDCFFFEGALAELATITELTTVHDGEQLMKRLTGMALTDVPFALFLDLNMPRKNGFECLLDIKNDPTLSRLPVIILSTYFTQDMATKLYQNGAHFCIQKPAEFNKLKQVIQQVLTALAETDVSRPARENFVLVSA